MMYKHNKKNIAVAIKGVAEFKKKKKSQIWLNHTNKRQ